MTTRFDITDSVRILKSNPEDHNMGGMTLSRYAGHVSQVESIRIHRNSEIMYLLDGIPLLIPEKYLEEVTE